MKKISTILTAAIFSLLSATAFACPQGTSLTGGTGANHKGGKCVAVQKTAQHQAPTANHNVKNTEQPTQVPANTHQTATTTQKDMSHTGKDKTTATAKMDKSHLNKAKTATHKAPTDVKPLKS